MVIEMLTLRERAEHALNIDSRSLPYHDAEIHRLYHELQIHQIELELQNDELQQAKDAAELALQEQRRVCAALSHDLAQPVYALQIFLQSLQASSPLTAEQHKILSQIASSAASLRELSGALNELNHHAHAEPAADLRPVALAPLLASALNDHLPIAHQKGLAIHLVATGAVAFSEPVSLRRIIGNLISNAVRFTPNGNILVGVRRSGSDALRIEVRDNGIGIAEENLPRIHDDFFQVGNVERNPENGHGLGLAIARRLSIRLGHRLAVRSSPGRGSLFSLTLPRAPA